MKPNDTPNAPIKTAQRTLRVIEGLKDLGGATIQELSDHLGMSKSSTHDYLKTLERGGYVVKEEYTYTVGLRFLDLGGYARRKYPLYTQAEQEMKKLARETEELVDLVVEEYGFGYVFLRQRSPKSITPNTYVGERIELHSSAAGKILLAHLPQDRISDIIEQRDLVKRTEKTMTEPDEIYDELERIRNREVALSVEEQIQGLISIAVPIIPENRIIGSMSISGPAYRLESKQTQEEYISQLQNVRNVIELRINHKYR